MGGRASYLRKYAFATLRPCLPSGSSRRTNPIGAGLIGWPRRSLARRVSGISRGKSFGENFGNNFGVNRSRCLRLRPRNGCWPAVTLLRLYDFTPNRPIPVAKPRPTLRPAPVCPRLAAVGLGAVVFQQIRFCGITLRRGKRWSNRGPAAAPHVLRPAEVRRRDHRISAFAILRFYAQSPDAGSRACFASAQSRPATLMDLRRPGRSR